MANFVFVADKVTAVQFQKALEIKNRAGEKVRFLPQGSSGDAVKSSGLRSEKREEKDSELYSNVRFEWTEDGVEFGVQIVQLFATA